jgi:hypothetical protein
MPIAVKQLIRRAKRGTDETRMTLVSPRHLEWLMQYVTKLPPGAVMVECGVARGGCIALCHYVRPDMVIYGFDSWQGMPELTEQDNASKCVPQVGRTFGTMSDVLKTYTEFGSSPENLHLIRGWFEDTVPATPLPRIDILRIDCDFYKAVRYVLETMYDKVPPGGLVIFDDWHFNPEGVRQAWNDYAQMAGIDEDKIDIKLHEVGRGPSYFFKPEN